jgi:hypothetical protein
MTIREAAALVLKRYYGGQVRNDNDVTEYQVAAHIGTIRNRLVSDGLAKTKGIKLKMDEGLFTRRTLEPELIGTDWYIKLPNGYVDAPDLLSVVVRPASQYIQVPESWLDGNHRLLNLEGNIGWAITPDGNIRLSRKPASKVMVDVVEPINPQSDIDEPLKIPSELEQEVIEQCIVTLRRVQIDTANDGEDRA